MFVPDLALARAQYFAAALHTHLVALNARLRLGHRWRNDRGSNQGRRRHDEIARESRGIAGLIRCSAEQRMRSVRQPLVVEGDAAGGGGTAIQRTSHCRVSVSAQSVDDRRTLN